MNPFHVIEEKEELSTANYGITGSRHQQVSASRAVDGNSFSASQISYKFSTSANQWWSPSQSFLRMRATLTKANGTTILTTADDVAPRSGLMANLYQSMELRINGVVVSRCTDNVGSVDAFLHRSTKSATWLKSIGAATNFYGDSYAKRLADVSSDGVVPRSGIKAVLSTDIDTTAKNADVLNAHFENSRRVKDIEMTWDCAPLSIFQSDQNVPPGCDIELILNPYGGSQYKNNAIESTTAKVSGNGNAFDFAVTDQIFYAKIVEGPGFDNGQALLDLSNARCQAVDHTASGFTQKTFDVAPSTHRLTVAFQSDQLNDSSMSASEFVVNKTTHLERGLNRLFVSYDGKSLPQPDADPSFATNVDHTVQRYLETQQSVGAFDSESGGETLQEWLSRGAYYSFKWDRDGRSMSTRAAVNCQFAATLTHGRMLLIDESYSNVRLSYQNGRCVEVLVEDN